ncbi:MAG: hypothetical protein AB7Y74_09650 [Syntrophorhabdus sp.]|jgi:hypothetical protein
MEVFLNKTIANPLFVLWQNGEHGGGFFEQTVVTRGSLVFCECKSSEVERERMQPLEHNERVCDEIAAPMLIL